jgi:hypothetical protein
MRAMNAWIAGIGFVLAIVALPACGDSRSPTAPSPSPATLTSQVRTALERSLQDEYRAETIYQGVVEDLGSLAPFVNVLSAEQRHSASIGDLFVRRGLTPPANSWTLATVPHFTSTPVACSAAATAERGNVAMYDELLRLTLPADVRQVFDNVRLASLSNHLPAFERCS